MVSGGTLLKSISKKEIFLGTNINIECLKCVQLLILVSEVDMPCDHS